MRILLWMFCTLLLMSSCKTNKESVAETATSGVPSVVQFLDSIPASKAIVADDIDGFFDKISEVDMNIQLKKEKSLGNREKTLLEYKKLVTQDVSNWSVTEKAWMFEVFTKVKEMCDSVGPRIFPGGVRLIKIKTNHYGKDVYYTRGKDILIPENIFIDFSAQKQIPVMIHELFHVISRYSPDVKQDLYAMIGFKPTLLPVVIDPILNKKVLTNPDGVAGNYFIDLKSPTGTIEKAIPLISSKWSSFDQSKPSFFNYLEFDLYPIVMHGDHYEVECDSKGHTTLAKEFTQDFFAQIKDNTQYIIHPDEIMADNFMLAIQANYQKDFSKFSENGKQLIDQVLVRLREM